MGKSIKLKSNNETVYPYPYLPIGYIYISVLETNPSTFFGGTWERIKDKFLLACGETYSNGDTGGSLETGSHALTEQQLPVISAQPKANVVCHQPHEVSAKYLTYRYAGKSGNLGGGNYLPYGQFKLSFGGGQGHTHTQNLPPYLAVYMWVKTAN